MKNQIAFILIGFVFSQFTLAQSPAVNSEARLTVIEDSLKLVPENTRLLMELGINYHKMASQGDPEMAEKAEKVFEKLIQLQPRNSQAHCWYGSILTMKARAAWFPITKAKYVNDGVKEMDQAVALDSTNVKIRLIRARTGLALPGFFNRTPISVRDLEFVVGLQSKRPGMFDNITFAGILLDLGRAYQKQDRPKDAEIQFQKVIALAPDSELATQAKNFLTK